MSVLELGAVPDAQLSRLLGVSPWTVRCRREAAGISARGKPSPAADRIVFAMARFGREVSVHELLDVLAAGRSFESGGLRWLWRKDTRSMVCKCVSRGLLERTGRGMVRLVPREVDTTSDAFRAILAKFEAAR